MTVPYPNLPELGNNFLRHRLETNFASLARDLDVSQGWHVVAVGPNQKYTSILRAIEDQISLGRRKFWIRFASDLLYIDDTALSWSSNYGTWAGTVVIEGFAKGHSHWAAPTIPAQLLDHSHFSLRHVTVGMEGPVQGFHRWEYLEDVALSYNNTALSHGISGDLWTDTTVIGRFGHVGAEVMLDTRVEMLGSVGTMRLISKTALGCHVAFVSGATVQMENMMYSGTFSGPGTDLWPLVLKDVFLVTNTPQLKFSADRSFIIQLGQDPYELPW